MARTSDNSPFLTAFRIARRLGATVLLIGLLISSQSLLGAVSGDGLTPNALAAFLGGTIASLCAAVGFASAVLMPCWMACVILGVVRQGVEAMQLSGGRSAGDSTKWAGIDSGEQLPGEQLPGEQLPGDQLPGEQLSGEQLPDDAWQDANPYARVEDVNPYAG